MRPVLLSNLFLLLLVVATGRRHILRLKNEIRSAVLCSTFGFLKGGYFSVLVDELNGDLRDITFTFDKDGNSGAAAFIEAKTGNCFHGEPHRFLYLSFDPSQKLLLIHNQDVSLQGLVFEPGAENASDEGTQNIILPTTLKDAIQVGLDALHLVPEHSSEVASQLNTLLYSVPELEVERSSFNLSFIYSLLRRLSQKTLSSEMLNGLSDTKVMMKRQANLASEQETSINSTITSNIPSNVFGVLKTIYRLTTPLGSLRAIPYEKSQHSVEIKFTIRFPSTREEGLYNLYIHNCPSFGAQLAKRSAMNLTLQMVEKNPDSYLSAGQQPLPLLYSSVCCIYFLASLFWFTYIRLSKKSKYRIHYLMFIVVLVKAISLLFNALNYYVVGKHGVQEEGWAVMYYITHIIRGALLFTTILLIGAGWTFIKHMLTPRERNVFIVVIPLQILANVATVIVEESEAGTARYALWKDIFIFVDLACCGAILFPVVWSIRHLQAASETDGKAALNLHNLKLFRRFYILVICYVYFTRVIAYLLLITIPYSLTWIIELFKEAITFAFFVAVGYTFRPVDDNPYLLIHRDQDDEDTVMERIQLEHIWSQSPTTDGVTRLHRPPVQHRDDGSSSLGKTNPAFFGRAATQSERSTSSGTEINL